MLRIESNRDFRKAKDLASGTIIREGDQFHILVDDTNNLSKDDGYRPCITLSGHGGSVRLNGYDPHANISASNIVGKLIADL